MPPPIGRQKHERERATAEMLSELLVFGYSCKTFYDTDKHTEHNTGKHLMALHGDTQLLVDRYDCRLHVHELSEYEYNSDRPVSNTTGNDDDESEKIEEQMCDELRYHDLWQIQHNEAKEEERKRASAAHAQVAYNYDQHNTNGAEVAPSSSSEEDTPYVPVPQLKVPMGVPVPDTAQQAYIIHKTGVFIADQGAQMEIVIKAKQRESPKFAFLTWDHPLNHYYKHALKMIKNGRYVPDMAEPKRNKKLKRRVKVAPVSNGHQSGSESDSSGDCELHPSLMAVSSSSRLATPPSVNSPTPTHTPPLSAVPVSDYKLGEGNDVYSALFNRISALQPKPVVKKELTPSDQLAALHKMSLECSAKMQPQNEGAPPNDYCEWHEWMYHCKAPDGHQPAVVPPPPDLAPVVNTAAELVAAWGLQAETMLKEDEALQMSFVLHNNSYHGFYHLRLRCVQFDQYYRQQHAIQLAQQQLEQQTADWNAYYNTQPQVKERDVVGETVDHTTSSAEGGSTQVAKAAQPVCFAINKQHTQPETVPSLVQSTVAQEDEAIDGHTDFVDSVLGGHVGSPPVPSDGQDSENETEVELRLARKLKAQLFLEKIMKSKREKRLIEQQQMMQGPETNRTGSKAVTGMTAPVPPIGVVIPKLSSAPPKVEKSSRVASSYTRKTSRSPSSSPKRKSKKKRSRSKSPRERKHRRKHQSRS